MMSNRIRHYLPIACSCMYKKSVAANTFTTVTLRLGSSSRVRKFESCCQLNQYDPNKVFSMVDDVLVDYVNLFRRGDIQGYLKNVMEYHPFES